MTELEQTALDTELAAVRATWGPHLEHLQAKAGRVVGLQRLMFTYALLADVTTWGYELRWCYSSYEKALAALNAWDGAEGTEPEGWHRDPVTGRRRPDGDAAREYVEH